MANEAAYCCAALLFIVLIVLFSVSIHANRRSRRSLRSRRYRQQYHSGGTLAEYAKCLKCLRTKGKYAPGPCQCSSHCQGPSDGCALTPATPGQCNDYGGSPPCSVPEFFIECNNKWCGTDPDILNNWNCRKNATKCNHWSCSKPGQYCPPGVPGSSSDGDGYCCNGTKWIEGGCKEGHCPKGHCRDGYTHKYCGSGGCYCVKKKKKGKNEEDYIEEEIEEADNERAGK